MRPFDPPNDMQSYETITGQKALDLIAWLAESRTFLTLSVPHRSYERLTFIISIGILDGKGAFKIDPPEGLLDLLSQTADERSPTILQFEFTGIDRLQHRFDAPVAAISEQELWLQCPARIQRDQHRRDFRIQAPDMAELVLHIESKEIRLSVDDLSLGGVLCHCTAPLKTLFLSDMILEDADLLVTIDGVSCIVTLDRLAVRRIDKGPISKNYDIAFEFLAIKNEFRKRLTKIVYDMQRRFLRNRLQEKS